MVYKVMLLVKKIVELGKFCKAQGNKLRFKKINYVQWGPPHSILHVSYGTEKKHIGRVCWRQNNDISA
jgi:hypothetical protein